ncbi:hypothetical protein VTJ49DRAFT_4115 [Mycothermus thermophilus]|uniref:Pyoverdine/dityrosine biosynthesis protein n=1 Tax=Humicola insolens TaxID=85995 RepID=A0ABR3V621_HUMIN
MEVSNEGESFYHRFEGSVVYNSSGELVYCTGPRCPWMEENWTALRSSPLTLPRDVSIKVYHSRNPDSTQPNVSAVIVHHEADRAVNTAFEEFFVQLILDQADLCASSPPTIAAAEAESTTQVIVDLFDRYLRYEGKDDKWLDCGRSYFAERIRHFTSRNMPIQLCLPAFPCKSSNTDKVTGTNPDLGEELALERLHGFVEAVELVYAPGAKLWIISDGHVFSDCIGVDDAAVDAYGAKLKEMNHAVGLRRGKVDRVGFKSLVDLFELASVGRSAEQLAELARRLDIPNIEHHIATKLTDEAELCRRILMAGCGPKKSAVRARINSKDAAITALYRGFSRFMLEDLEHHPHTQSMSKAQRKKLSSRVAFEMILRNQAYSNLVEMVFPNHVRLSIHAHNNAGPKFGIQLFDAGRVRAVMGLSPDGELMTSLDLLHIPTPWHNSVVQLADSDVVLVTKAKIARAALEAGSMTESASPAEVPAAAAAEVPERQIKKEEEPGEASIAPQHAIGEDKPRQRRRATLSEKADAVVTAVVRRNSTVEPAKRDTWLGRLRSKPLRCVNLLGQGMLHGPMQCNGTVGAAFPGFLPCSWSTDGRVTPCFDTSTFMKLGPGTCSHSVQYYSHTPGFPVRSCCLSPHGPAACPFTHWNLLT